MVAKSSPWLKPYKRMGCLPPTGAGTLPKMCASLMPRHLIQCLTGHVAHLRLQWAPAQDDSMKILVEIENLGAGIPGLGLKTRTPSTKNQCFNVFQFSSASFQTFPSLGSSSFIHWMEVPKTSDCGNGQCWLRQNYTDLTSPKHVGMYQNRDSYFWRIILELFSYTVSGVTSKLWWVGAKSSCNFHNLFIPFFCFVDLMFF